MSNAEDDTKLYCMDVHKINEYIENTYSDSELQDSSNKCQIIKIFK